MPDRAPSWRAALQILGVAVVYLVAAKAGLHLTLVQPNATPVWPPAGIALAALLLLGPGCWPGVMLGAAVANATTAATPLAAALLIAAGNTLAGVVGAAGLRRVWRFDPALRSWRDLHGLLAFAVIVPPLLSATNGTLQVALFDLGPVSTLAEVWWVWFSGDALGILVVAPAILVWGSRKVGVLSGWRRLEAGVLMSAMAACCLAIFAQRLPGTTVGAGMAFTVFPFLMWAAVRFGMRGAATATLVVAAAAVTGTVLHQGPFAGQALHLQLPLLQLFIGIAAVSAQFLAVLIEEREEREARLVHEVEARGRAERTLLVAHEGLEQRVAERTASLAAVVDRLKEEVAQRRRAEEELRSYRDHLEELVAQRTVELAVARDRAEAADRLKSVFLATMSHELRTPLNSIIGFTGLLAQGMGGPVTEEQARQLGMVKSSASHLLSLINDVLDLSKIEAGQIELEMTSFDLGAAIRRVADLVKPLAEKKGLALAVAADADVGGVTSDRRRVEQVLLNLLSNAVKFTDAGEVTVRAARRGADYEIGISDTGVGIKPEQLPKLFRPFQQLDSGPTRRAEGTGLGLSISRNLAEKLGGSLSVASEWGHGTTVTFVLPAATGTSEAHNGKPGVQ